MVASPMSAPTSPWATSFATTTRPRRGVARKVVVTVWCRYSPAIPSTPSSRAIRVITLAGAPRAWTKLCGPSGSLPCFPATE